MSSIIVNVSWLIIVPIFLLLFAVIWQAAKRSSLLPEPACFIVALCVSILCIIGMFNFDTSAQTKSLENVPEPQTTSAGPRQEEHQFILLPYIALGVSILATFIIMALVKAWAALKGFFITLRQNVKDVFAPLDRLSKKRPSIRSDKTRKES